MTCPRALAMSEPTSWQSPRRMSLVAGCHHLLSCSSGTTEHAAIAPRPGALRRAAPARQLVMRPAPTSNTAAASPALAPIRSTAAQETIFEMSRGNLRVSTATALAALHLAASFPHRPCRNRRAARKSLWPRPPFPSMPSIPNPTLPSGWCVISGRGRELSAAAPRLPSRGLGSRRLGRVRHSRPRALPGRRHRRLWCISSGRSALASATVSPTRAATAANLARLDLRCQDRLRLDTERDQLALVQDPPGTAAVGPPGPTSFPRRKQKPQSLAFLRAINRRYHLDLILVPAGQALQAQSRPVPARARGVRRPDDRLQLTVIPLPTPSCCASQAAATSLSRCSSTALTPRRPRSPAVRESRSPTVLRERLRVNNARLGVALQTLQQRGLAVRGRQRLAPAVRSVPTRSQAPFRCSNTRSEAHATLRSSLQPTSARGAHARSRRRTTRRMRTEPYTPCCRHVASTPLGSRRGREDAAPSLINRPSLRYEGCLLKCGPRSIP